MPEDGIAFLLDQHRQIEALLSAVQGAEPSERQARFDELRELLAVHETAEELILRPVTRRELTGGDAIADARIAEENQSKDTLAALEKIDATTPEFAEQFPQFATDVHRHAHNEEEHEFPLVRDQLDAETLKQLAVQLAGAEKLAPTHPHPSARSTAANLVLGPFAAMVDQIKDALSR
jgi:hemerythrin superfamily protein